MAQCRDIQGLHADKYIYRKHQPLEGRVILVMGRYKELLEFSCCAIHSDHDKNVNEW